MRDKSIFLSRDVVLAIDSFWSIYYSSKGLILSSVPVLIKIIVINKGVEIVDSSRILKGMKGLVWIENVNYDFFILALHPYCIVKLISSIHNFDNLFFYSSMGNRQKPFTIKKQSMPNIQHTSYKFILVILKFVLATFYHHWSNILLKILKIKFNFVLACRKHAT